MLEVKWEVPLCGEAKDTGLFVWAVNQASAVHAAPDSENYL